MVKVKRIIFTYIEKQSHLLIYLTVIINFFSKIFYKFHRLFLYESLESKFDLAIKNAKVNPRSSLEHFWGKIFKTFHEILCSKIFSCLILPRNKSRSTQGHYLDYLGITLVINLVPLLHTKFQGYWLTV